MAFLDDEKEGGPPNKINLLGMVIGFMVLGFVIKFAATGNIFGVKQRWTPDRVEAELMADSQGREIYQTIKDAYPADYRLLLGRLTTLAASGTLEERQREMGAFTRRLMIEHLDGLARAPSYQLVEIARQYTLLIGTLQRIDPATCAQFLTSGAAPGMQPPPEAQAIMGRIAMLQVRAARAGEAQAGAAPLRPEPSAQEDAALLAEVGRRSPEAQRLLMDQNAMRLAPQRQQCAAGLALYQTIETLPPESSARMTVSMLRGSFGQAAPPTPVGTR